MHVACLFGVMLRDHRLCLVMKRYADSVHRLLAAEAVPLERAVLLGLQLFKGLGELHALSIAVKVLTFIHACMLSSMLHMHACLHFVLLVGACVGGLKKK